MMTTSKQDIVGRLSVCHTGWQQSLRLQHNPKQKTLKH